MLVTILFAVALGYLMQFKPAILREPRQLATLGALMLAILLIAKVVVPIDPRAQYIVPMAAVPMLVATLMDTGLGIIVALAVGLLTGIIADNLLDLTLIGFLGGAIGAIYVHRLERLGQWVTAGILVAGAQFVTIVALASIERRQSVDEVLGIGAIALVNGLLAALIAAGALTYLGEVTRVITPMKLLELMTPNNRFAETAHGQCPRDLQPLHRGRQPGRVRGGSGRGECRAGPRRLLLPRHREDPPPALFRGEPGGHRQYP